MSIQIQSQFMPKMNACSQEEIIHHFKAGMRKYPSGVTLLTSIHNGKKTGLIATAFSSVSMDPPMLLVCVNRSASAHETIDQSNLLCVNILSENDLGIINVFSDSQKKSERFIDGEWANMCSGTPYLQTAIAAYDCIIVDKVVSGSHTIFIAEIKEAFHSDSNDHPIIYSNRAFHTLK